VSGYIHARILSSHVFLTDFISLRAASHDCRCSPCRTKAAICPGSFI